jgi:hypothetical protein
MSINWDDLVLGPVMGIFGDGIIYIPRVGAPVPIKDAVFDEEAKELVIGDDGQATTQKMPVWAFVWPRSPLICPSSHAE